MYSETVVIWIATAVALLDVLFIMVAVPESLPEKLRPASWGSAISWEKADPFGVSGGLAGGGGGGQVIRSVWCNIHKAEQMRLCLKSHQYSSTFLG